MEEGNSFSKQAAKASWVAPLVAIGVLAFANSLAKSNPGAFKIIALVSPIFFVVGFILGVVALFGIKRHGKKDILVPGIFGIVLNLGILTLLILIAVSAARSSAGG